MNSKRFYKRKAAEKAMAGGDSYEPSLNPRVGMR